MQEETKGDEIVAKKQNILTFDPDEDGFDFGYEKACVLHKNMNIL